MVLQVDLDLGFFKQMKLAYVTCEFMLSFCLVGAFLFVCIILFSLIRKKSLRSLTRLAHRWLHLAVICLVSCRSKIALV